VTESPGFGDLEKVKREMTSEKVSPEGGRSIGSPSKERSWVNGNRVKERVRVKVPVFPRVRWLSMTSWVKIR
jgi:hypothetical protein